MAKTQQRLYYNEDNILPYYIQCYCSCKDVHIWTMSSQIERNNPEVAQTTTAGCPDIIISYVTSKYLHGIQNMSATRAYASPSVESITLNPTANPPIYMAVNNVRKRPESSLNSCRLHDSMLMITIGLHNMLSRQYTRGTMLNHLHKFKKSKQPDNYCLEVSIK